MKVQFQRVQRSRVLRFQCTGQCKKKSQRTVKSECTVNPFNKNEDGTIKSHMEVVQQVDAKIVADVEKFLEAHLAKPCDLCGGKVFRRA